MVAKETWNSNLFKHTNIYFYLTYIIVVVVIFYYGHYRCKHIKDHTDILEFQLFEHKSLKNFDGWCCTHFVLFSIMGYVFPHSIRLSFLFSVIWELFEYSNEKFQPKFLNGITDCNSPNEHRNTGWWYGKWEDIVINSIGLFIGRTLRLGFVL